jgi:sporulation protein YlmC with PRC-barrel domain
MRTLVAFTALAAVVSSPALAQRAGAASAPSGVVATTNNPNLAVATVKLENGTRASKIIGVAVVLDSGEKVGSIDDLVMTEGDKVTVAVVTMGGVLGVGGKLVAIPYSQLKLDADRVLIPGLTKDALTAMPSFVY